MLERDQGWVAPRAIYEELRRLAAQFTDLTSVTEIWIADTASFDQKREWVEFSRQEEGVDRWSFAFYKDALEFVGRNGIPIFDY